MNFHVKLITLIYIVCAAIFYSYYSFAAEEGPSCPDSLEVFFQANHKDIGARIRAVRLHFHLTPSKLAEKLNYPIDLLRQYEKGQQIVSDRFLVALNDAFEIGPLWLLFGKPQAEVASKGAPTSTSIQSKGQQYKKYLEGLTKNSKKQLRSKPGPAFSHIVTQNKSMQKIFNYIKQVSGTDQPITITGETGTGKELIALSIHKSGTNHEGPFVSINIAGLDDHMFSDTLFGHAKGAFTGALQKRDGLIASATNGTLFLDEIGDLSHQSQIKLLRVLQERTFLPVGSDKALEVNANIVVATNKNLEDMVAKGQFREDLYYRLIVHTIQLPPLKKRIDDLPLLIDHFIKEASRAFKKTRVISASDELIAVLSTLTYPGNIRELRSIIFNAVAMTKGPILTVDALTEGH